MTTRAREQCVQPIAALGFYGERQRCSHTARFTVTKDAASKRVCLQHLRKLRDQGWEKVR